MRTYIGTVINDLLILRFYNSKRGEKELVTQIITKKRFVILLIAFLLIGILLSISDFKTSLIYFTYVPIYFFAVLFSLGNVILFSFSLYFFFAISIGGVLFYYNRNQYWVNGIMGIGNFDFSFNSFLKMNLYLFVYFVVIFVILFWVGRKFNVNTGWKLLRKKHPENKKNKMIVTIVWGLIILQIVLFYFGIAIHGLNPRELQFHLWGGYWYFRMLIAPILLFFVLKSNESIICWLSVLVYIYIISVCSLSCSTIVFSSIPGVFFLKNKKWYKVILYFYFVLLCIYISNSLRSSVYESSMNGHMISFIQILRKTVKLISIKQLIKAPLKTMIIITERMGGGCNIVQAGQVRTNFKLSEFINFQITERLPNLSLNKLEEITQMRKVYGNYEGLNVGYRLSYLGCIILICQYNFLAAAIHAIIVAIPISSLYIILWSMHRRKYYKAEKTANVLFALMFMFFIFGGFNGFSVLQLYKETIVCFIVFRVGIQIHSKFLGGKIISES